MLSLIISLPPLVIHSHYGAKDATSPTCGHCLSFAISSSLQLCTAPASPPPRRRLAAASPLPRRCLAAAAASSSASGVCAASPGSTRERHRAGEGAGAGCLRVRLRCHRYGKVSEAGDGRGIEAGAWSERLREALRVGQVLWPGVRVLGLG